MPPNLPFSQMLKNLYSQNPKNTQTKNWPTQPSPRNIGRSWPSHMAFDLDEEGEGIDLTKPIPDASEDEYFEEGKAGKLYDDNKESNFIASDDNEGEAVWNYSSGEIELGREIDNYN
ncbi:hypothetical protein VP01_4110g1 [Puccinia sorghi]|uniref:Uncharacterized protein n=1 Tax=Puccinia sorghi TaxID=27349 RepID=A0A0L6UR75_9BASI|nr:hypothetical protein VP01_4110g1 [Puccinia sorghi]